MLRRDQNGKLHLPPEELEGSSFDDLTAGLADVTITRARALKLGGAALAGSAFTLLWPAEADARRRKKRRKNKRRKKVKANPAQVDFGPVPANPDPLPQKNVTITNNGTEPVSVSLNPGSNNQFAFAPNVDPSTPFNPSAPILPGTRAEVPITFTPDVTLEPGASQQGTLIIVDADGNQVTAVPLEGTLLPPVSLP
jgi:hypothetical protein